MENNMNKRRALAGLLPAVAIATVVGTGTAEGAGSDHLAIEPAGSGMYFVSVTGEAPEAAQNISLCVNLYGDDTWFDEHLFGGFGPACGNTTNSAGHYSISFTVPGYTLNEDWGRDEVYAYVTFGVFKSNTVTGNY
jgi:hypothetical protein